MTTDAPFIVPVAEQGSVSESSSIAETCPVETAIFVLAGRWKLLLLRALFLHGPLRYGDLRRRVAAISPKELTRNLRELEYAGLVMRSADTETYRLTELGHGLEPTFRLLGEFGGRYLASRRPGASTAP